MKTVSKIAKSVLLYLFVMVALNIVFCSIYYFYGINVELSFWELFLSSLSGNLEADMLKGNLMLLLYSLYNFLELICASVLTGFIFAYILNREPKVILPKKLVIRHRTSEGVENLLTIGIMVGNKSRFNIHDVCCTVRCYYVKNINPLRANGEFEIKQEVHVIQNFFRFSFDLKQFPRKILKDYIDKETAEYKMDSISVSVSGHSNLLGNSFMIARRYSLSDIIIDEHTPNLIQNVKIPFLGNKTYQRVNWAAIDEYEEVGEDKRKKVVKEIKSIIKCKGDKKH